ncbi:MAG: hypothetical protein HRT53_12905 [Colwellia sp.]|nr:hypothetical protein [Colwellia sp.]
MDYAIRNKSHGFLLNEDERFFSLVAQLNERQGYRFIMHRYYQDNITLAQGYLWRAQINKKLSVFISVLKS